MIIFFIIQTILIFIINILENYLSVHLESFYLYDILIFGIAITMLGVILLSQLNYKIFQKVMIK